MAVSLVSTMGRPVPYITVAELKASPIYNQLKSLVPGSSDATRDAELGRIIARASSMINGDVHQNLAATIDLEVGQVRVSSDGDLRINTRSNPIIEVLSLEIGNSPANLTAVTDLSNLVLEPWRIILPGVVGTTALNLPSLTFRPGARMWARWSYINGFPVAVLATPVIAGATAITVTDATGIKANQTYLTVEDGKNLEQFIPSAVSGNVLTVAPLAFAHPAGTGVSALPDAIKETTLLLISRLHDTWSLTMNSVAMDGSGARKPGALPDVMCEAARMLLPYRRVW